MNSVTVKNNKKRQRRKWRVRKNLRGTPNKPRLSVFKSNRHLAVQLIDDEQSRTIASTSTLDKEFKGTSFSKKSKEAAAKIGEKIAQLAQQNAIKEVIFDRGPYKYHGLLAELANAARSAGLKF